MAGERVTERAGHCAVQQRRVRALDPCDAEVDDARTGRAAGALPVGGAGRHRAEAFVRLEALAIRFLVTGGARTGADGHVGGAEVGGLTVGARREVGNRGAIEEP